MAFGIAEKIIAAGLQIVEKYIPDPQARARAEQELREQLVDLDKSQMQVNATEAANPNWFVAGWRPAVGWIGALALGYAAILEPVARFIAQVVFHYGGSFPAIDTSITMQILLGILGLGTMRSFDKFNGVAK